MALGVYGKTTWVDNSTPSISAANLNNIENGIDAVTDEAIDLRADLTADEAAITALDGRLDTAEADIVNAETNLDVLNDMRAWDATRTYAQNEPTFRNGIPYRSLANGNVGNDPATNPDDWEVVGGSGGGTENFLKNDLTKNNVLYVTKSAGVTSIAWDTGTDAVKLLSAGALKVVVPSSGTRTLDIDLVTLNPNDVGQPFSVKFSYLQDAAADNVAVSLYDGTTDTLTALGTLPQAGGTMQTVSGAVFPTIVLATQRLRFTFSGGTGFNFYLADVSVAPFVATSGAAISGWAEYPLVITSSGSSPSKGTAKIDKAYWRRVGSDIQVRIAYIALTAGTAGTGTYLFNLPAGLQIDQQGFSTYQRIYGNCKVATTDSDTHATTIGVVRVTSSFPSNFILSVLTDASSSSKIMSDVGASLYALSGANVVYLIDATFPIANWTSNVNLATDFTEYASNSSSADADDTTSFVYGPDGSAGIFNTTNLGSTARSKRVRFQRPIQVGDKISVEVHVASSGRWVDVANTIHNVNKQGSAYSGIRVNTIFVNATDIDIIFYQYATFDGIGWVSMLANYAIDRWRVRKVSNGNMAEQPPVVHAAYDPSGSQSPGAGGIIQFNTKIEDTHNAVTTGASWKFTAPVPGLYGVSTYLTTGSGATDVFIYKNGTVLGNGNKLVGYAASDKAFRSYNVVRLAVGDYIDLRAVSAVTFNTSLNIQITRIGS